MKTETAFSDRLVHVLSISLGIAVFVVYAALAFYAHPSSDDFCMAAGIRQYGLFDYLWQHYIEWSGRYSSNMLYGTYPLLTGLFKGYRYFPVVLILLLVLASCYLIATVFRVRLFDRTVIAASLGFLCVYLAGLLDPASSLYWLAGAMTYQPANILLLVSLGLMLQLCRRQAEARSIAAPFVLLLVTLVFAVGLNETAMVALALLVFAALLYHLRAGKEQWLPWLLLLLVTLACIAIVYFSPGNAVRASDFPLRHDWGRSISGSLITGTKMLWIWLADPVLLAASALTPFAFARLQRSSAVPLPIGRSWIAALLTGTLALPLLLQFPAWWSMGGWPPPRTQDAIYFIFLVGWLLTIGAFTLYAIDRTRTGKVSAGAGGNDTGGSATARRAVPAVAMVILAAAVIGSDNVQTVKTDLSQRAMPWDTYMQQRYAKIRQARAAGSSRLSVPDYTKTYPQGIYFNDIMHNAQHWRNECYARYFGLDEIRRLRGPGIPSVNRRQAERTDRPERKMPAPVF